jgi:2'-5' RNA ligase
MKNEKMIRAFVAVDMNDAVRGEVGRAIEQLKRSGADVKWLRPEALHFTLKFLGDISEDAVPDIINALDRKMENMTPFDLQIGSAGVFPGWSNPRVIWFGLERGADEMRDLAREVDRALTPLGIEAEKREYRPHLTLGRLRSRRNKQILKDYAEGVRIPSGKCRVSKAVLFKSELTPSGAFHSPISEMFLKSV